MKSFKEQCIELRKKDKTLNEIVEITGRSKTSVYFHIRDIPLSKKKQKEISRNARKRALAVSASRRGKSDREYKEFDTWTPDSVLLVAHLIFDGDLRRTTCGYSNRSKALINCVEKLFKLVYGYPAKRHFDTRSGVINIRHHNVALAGYLIKKSNKLIAEIEDLPQKHQREFIRAFFDDEGCMDVRLNKNLRRIRGYQNDKHFLDLIVRLLKNFDIESTFKKPNEVVITGKENLKKFQKEINFSKGVRLNPNRTNSLWKKDIEKRTLLDIAIKSFKT